MVKRYCDFCGKETKYALRLKLINVEEGNMEVEDGCDICLDCYDEIAKAIDKVQEKQKAIKALW